MKHAYLLAFLPTLALATGKPQPPPKQPKPTATAQASATADQRQTAVSSADQSQTATATQSQTANGGSGGSSNQSQSATNAGNQQVSNYDYERQTAMAYAPSIAPTAACATARSGGVSTSVVGITGGASRIDIECETRETARLFAEMGYRETAALIACTTVAAQRAFNGRPCPIPAAPAAEQRVTVAIEDVRADRAEARGFVPAGK